MAKDQKKSRQKPKSDVRLGEGPFSFSGEPLGCWGKIYVINESEEWVWLPRLPLSGFELQTASGEPLNQIELAAHVGPGKTDAIAVNLALHPSTAGGDYQGSIILGEQSETLIISVVEKREIAILPRRVSLCGKPGKSLSSTIVVTNNGNVNCPLPSETTLALSDIDNLEVSAIMALQEVGQKGWEPTRDRFIQILSDLQVKPLRVNIRGAKEIPPGQSANINIALQIPRDIKPQHTYQGKATIFNERLQFDVQVI